jgi:hypothetical protein
MMNEANTGVRFESSTIPVAYQLQLTLEDAEVDDMLKLIEEGEQFIDTMNNTFRRRVTMDKEDESVINGNDNSSSSSSSSSSVNDGDDDDNDDDDDYIGEDFFSRVEEGASSSGQIVVVGNKWDKIWIQHCQKLKVCVDIFLNIVIYFCSHMHMFYL